MKTSALTTLVRIRSQLGWRAARHWLIAAALVWIGAVGCGDSPQAAHSPAVGVSLQQRAGAPRVGEIRGTALGTTWMVKWAVPAASAPSEGRVRQAVQAALDRVDAQMSTWRSDSELAQVRSGSGPVVVSEATAQVLREALALAEATGGAYDPTVQPLMEVYGFHDRGAPAPTPQALAKARAQVGWERVRPGRTAAGQPTVDAGGTAIDLSSIAKGYAVDRVSLALSRLGLGSHMVEVGGEMRVSGAGVSGPLWTVGIDDPLAGKGLGEQLAVVVSLTNAAVATSGNYRNTTGTSGERVAHVMDPRSGRPAQTPVLSVTVVAPDCLTADALATALMVLPLEQGQALVAARPEVAALWLVAEAQGFGVVQSEQMRAYGVRVVE